ncbi:MAG: hypothetical protein CMK32_06720 [Porticoccaceae bacterium]|nr:hypothetical protein [Porticoccaceae bacterium]
MSRAISFAALMLALSLGQSAFGQAEQKETDAEKHDRLKMNVQAICPISGNKLGEHGDPIKVKVGEEQVFLCCKGCLEKKIDPKHWETIHENFAKAQSICPVMEKALPAQPKWTVVEGQIVYVCCPPCIDKIKAESAKYLAAVDAAYEQYLKDRRSSPSGE